jgi:hypothetical protein
MGEKQTQRKSDMNSFKQHGTPSTRIAFSCEFGKFKWEVWVNAECVTCYSKSEAIRTQKRMLKKYADQ